MKTDNQTDEQPVRRTDRQTDENTERRIDRHFLCKQSHIFEL